MTRRKVADSASGAAPEPAAPLRPEGWFLAPVYAWFGPGWQPATVWGKDEVELRERASEARGERLAKGDTGSLGGLSKKSDARLASVTIERARLMAAGTARRGRR